MKLKTILSVPLAAALLLTGGAASAAQAEPPAKGEQIQLIVSALSVWKPARKGDYMLVDLDGNGRYEILTAKVSKKQVTELHAWEVDASGAFLVPVTEPWSKGDSQPDIRGADTAAVYYDAENDLRYYILGDIREKDDSQETDITAFWLKDGAFYSEVLATKTADGCFDAAGEPIDEAEFQNAAETRFAGLARLEAAFTWIDTTEHPLDNAPMEQILELAGESLAGFQVTETQPASGEAS